MAFELGTTSWWECSASVILLQCGLPAAGERRATAVRS